MPKLRKKHIIVVDGIEYEVTENLGFQNGHYAKYVLRNGIEVVAVKSRGTNIWRFWTAYDRFTGFIHYCGQGE